MMTACDCDYGDSGRCEVRMDEILREQNRRLLTEAEGVIAKRVSLAQDWAECALRGFAQKELQRLGEKRRWMTRLGVVAVAEVACGRKAVAQS